MDVETRLRRAPEAAFENVAGEAILIHLNTGTYYSLNEVGASFWNLLDGERSIADCAALIAAEYGAPEDVVLPDLLEVAGELMAEGLVGV